MVSPERRVLQYPPAALGRAHVLGRDHGSAHRRQRRADGTHEFFRPWLLWDRCFELAPEAEPPICTGLVGASNRRTTRPARTTATPVTGNTTPEMAWTFARHAGFFIRTWAVAYAHTQEPGFLTAIEDPPGTLRTEAASANGLDRVARAARPDVLSGAHAFVGDRLRRRRASRSRAAGGALAGLCGARGRSLLCAAPRSQRPRRICDQRRQDHRQAGAATHAALGRALRRIHHGPGRDDVRGPLRQRGKVGYRDLITNAANAYLASPPAEVDVWPMTLGHAISLQLAAWRHTAQAELPPTRPRIGHARRRDVLAEAIRSRRPGLKQSHYETITGADTPGAGTGRTAPADPAHHGCPCPPNTADR